MRQWKPRSNKDWPRGKNLSHHSPSFFAENKDRFLRQSLIRDIQAVTNRPLVVYYGSSSFQSSFRDEDVKRLYEVIYSFEGMDIDLFIETKGGETDATEAIVSCLANTCKSYRAIVPGRAKSNGTLICLSAQSLVLGATSELGPIEPLVNFVPASILLSQAYSSDLRLYDSRQAEKARDAIAQSKSLAQRYLLDGMMKDQEEKVSEVVACLCSRTRYHSHGSVINAKEAKELGLAVEIMPPNSDLWKMFILLHSLYKTDSDLRQISKFFEQETFSQQVIGDDPPIDLNGR